MSLEATVDLRRGRYLHRDPKISKVTKIPLNGKIIVLPLIDGNDHFTPRGRLTDECMLFVRLY